MSFFDSTGFSLTTGFGLSSLISIAYVLILYTSKSAVDGKEIDRNDPQVITSRIIKVTSLSILIVAILPSLLSKLSDEPTNKIYAELGFLPGLKFRYGELHWESGHLGLFTRDVLQSLLLVSILFVGPLIDAAFFSSPDPQFIVKELLGQLSTLQGIRDLIVGPLTEEIIYTSATIVTLYQVRDISTNTLIFLPPVFFSFAHFHHAYELYTKKAPIHLIGAVTAFQLLYTFLFGIFTNFVFLRTNNLWSCFAVHALCNFIGVPKFQVSNVKFQYWNYVYYALLVFGSIGFYRFLFTFTQSSLALVPWGR